MSDKPDMATRRAAYREKMAAFAQEESKRIGAFKARVEHSIGVNALAVSIEWREPFSANDACEIALRTTDRGAGGRASKHEIMTSLDVNRYADWFAYSLLNQLI